MILKRQDFDDVTAVETHYEMHIFWLKFGISSRVIVHIFNTLCDSLNDAIKIIKNIEVKLVTVLYPFTRLLHILYIGRTVIFKQKAQFQFGQII